MTFEKMRVHRSLWTICVIAIVHFALLTLAVLLAERPYWNVDLNISKSVQSISCPGFEEAMRVISLPGDELWLSTTLVGTAILVLYLLRLMRGAAMLLLVVLVGQVLKIGIKLLIARPRPTPDLVQVLINAKEIHSFPSGHTVHYMVFFGFLWFLAFTHVKRVAWRWPLLFFFGSFVLFVGLARIYLGAHWLTDVIGGYFLGGAILLAAIGLSQAKQIGS